MASRISEALRRRILIWHHDSEQQKSPLSAQAPDRAGEVAWEYDCQSHESHQMLLCAKAAFQVQVRMTLCKYNNKAEQSPTSVLKEKV